MAQEINPALHPAATQHLPGFITSPGESDVLMIVTGVFLLAGAVGFGILFLTLHTLPERMAHKSQKLQFEIVAVLGLIALFTHMHIFWVAGLLLALIDLPDFGGWLGRIAGSVERIADASGGGAPAQTVDQPGDEAIKPSQENVASIRRSEGVTAARTERAPASTRG
jgi:hypothetical protein